MKNSISFSLLAWVAFAAFSGQALAQTGNNLLGAYNPGFESGLSGWGGAGFQNARIDKDSPGEGIQSARLSANPSNAWNVLVNTSITVPVVPGNVYVLSALTRQNLVGGAALLGLNEINSSQQSTGYLFKTVADSSDWNPEYLTLIPKPDTSYLRVYLWVNPSSTSGYAWWDAIHLDTFSNSFLADESTSIEVSLPTVVFNYDGTTISPATLTPAVNLGDRFVGGIVSWKLVKETDGVGGAPLLQDVYAVGSMGVWQWPIDMSQIAQLGAGRYLLTITSISADGSETGSMTKPLAVVSSISSIGSMAQPSVSSSSVDGNGRLLVNGQPYQAVMYYGSRAADFAEMRALGATSVQITGNSVSVLAANIDQAWSAGLYSWVVLFQPPFVSGSGSATTWNTTYLKSAINVLKTKPGVIGWDLCDEPDGHNIPAGTVQIAYDAIKAADTDPNHVVWVNFARVSTFNDYAGCSDFASYDGYVFPMGELSTTSSMNAAIRQAQPNKPLISVLQNFGVVGFPSFSQLRAQLYTDVCDGMVHSFYYVWSAAPYFCLKNEPETKSYTQLLNWEMQQLQPFLFATNATLSVTVNNPNVRAVAKSVGSEVVLILVNQSDAPVEGAVGVVAGRSFTTHAAYFPGTTAGALNGGNLGDNLPAYGVGVYRLQ